MAAEDSENFRGRFIRRKNQRLNQRCEKRRAEQALLVRKEEAEAVKDQLARATEVQTAARLIANELLAAYTSATLLIEKKHWFAGDIARNFPLDAWERDKRMLARELPYKDWNALDSATRAVEHFRLSTSAPRSSDTASATTIDLIKPMHKDMARGLDALQPYI